MDKQRARTLRNNAFSEVSRYDPAIKAIRAQLGERAAHKVLIARALEKARKLGVRT